MWATLHAPILKIPPPPICTVIKLFLIEYLILGKDEKEKEISARTDL